MKKNVWIWITLAIMLMTGAVGFLGIRKHQIEAQVRDQLGAIAMAKVAQVENWRRERLEDAAVLTGNRLLADGLARWLRGEANPAILAELQSCLEPLRHPHGYQDYQIVDAAGRIRLGALEHSADTLDADTLAALREGWRTFQPTMTDIQDTGEPGHPRLNLIAPLYHDFTPAGAIILFIDPGQELFPLLKGWPTLRMSGETLLLRQEGQGIIPLNAEHGPVPASIAVPPVPGELILAKDRDGRGIAALALGVPRTPWTLMTWIDQSDIFAAGRRETALMGAGLTALIGLAGCLIALAWQIRQRQDERRLRRAEAAERDSLVQFHNLFHQSLDGIVVLAPDYRLLDANPAATRLLGYSREDLTLLRLPDLLAEQERQRLYQTVPGLLAGELQQQEWLHRRKDGSVFPGEVTARALTEERCFATIRDISQRKRAEHLILELTRQLERRVDEHTRERVISQERFKLAMEAASEALWDGDLTTGKFYYSPCFFRMLGYEPGDLPHNIHTWSRLLHPREQSETIRTMRRMIRSGTIDLECHMLDRNGHSRWVLCRGAVVAWNESGEPVRIVGTYLDITEHKKTLTALRESERRQHEWCAGLERQVARHRESLEAANREKGQFLAHISHEIRTPMQAILGLAQLLRDQYPSGEQAELIEHIRESGETLLHLINDILDASRIEAGQMTLEARPFELDGLIDKVDHTFRHMAQAKGLAFHCPRPSLALGSLLGDSLRLRQILLNLIGNAIKFTHAGHVDLCVMPVELSEHSARLRFEVSDTGIGISADALTELFQPFRQADASISRCFGGSGLGLSISQRLADLMGGKLGANSQPGIGSTFWLEIEFERVAEAPASVPTAAGISLQGLRVLAVDDQPINRLLVERALERAGAEVIAAGNGREALEQLSAWANDIDLVLMDMRMPVMDGLTATRAIRGDAALASLPVIALTAGLMADEREAALAAGVNDILDKPIDLAKLVELVSRHTSLARGLTEVA